MSILQSIADQLRALAQQTGPIYSDVEAAADRLRQIADRVASLKRSGVDTRSLEGAILNAEVHAEQAADAVRQIQSDGVDWANQLASGGSQALHHSSQDNSLSTASPLDDEDRAAILNYSDKSNGSYREMNGMALGINPWTIELAARSRRLSRALSKLDPYLGTVLRGTNLAAHGGWDIWRPNTLVTTPQFFSSDRTTPYEGDTLFIIDSKRGKSIRQYSQNAAMEDEVLFDRNTTWFVLEHEVIDNPGHPEWPLHVIYLEET